MRFPTAVLVLTVGCLALVLSACGDSATNDSQPSPTAFASKVQTPVAEAREAGITPYWFGESFVKDSQEFRWPADYADVASLSNQLPGISFDYSGVVEGGYEGYLSVSSYPPEESIDYGRELARRLGEVTEEKVYIEGWAGDVIWQIDKRGVLRPFVFLRNKDAAVKVVSAISPENTGPLSDLDSLLAIIEEHLRPFPE